MRSNEACADATPRVSTTQRMGPVVTLMMGRVEDWLRVVVDRDGLTIDPDALPWSGVAVFKRAYGEFLKRGFRARLLGAAIRHHYHWSELIGGDVVITMPASWQRRFNASDVEVRPRIDDPVPPAFLVATRRRLDEFTKAYEPDGPRHRCVRRIRARRLGRSEPSSPRTRRCSRT